jgi:PAS domain S-box-containing protein
MLREVKSATDTGLFESLANSIPALVWIADASKACVWVNKEWLDFTGRRMEQEIGRGWIEGIHPDDVLRCLRTFEQHHRKRTPYEIEFRLRHHSGDYRWVLDKAAPRYNEKGQFAGYTGACIDISERRMVEETLQESELHIRLANEATGVGIWAWNVKCMA